MGIMVTFLGFITGMVFIIIINDVVRYKRVIYYVWFMLFKRKENKTTDILKVLESELSD
jgi:hypothetical protein